MNGNGRDQAGLIARAEQAAASGDPAGASGLYEAALACPSGQDGARLRAMGGLCAVQTRLGEADAALATAKAALALRRSMPGDGEAALAILHSMAGHALMRLTRFAEAAAAYREALRCQEAAGLPGATRAATLNLIGEADFRGANFAAAAETQAAAVALLRHCLPKDDPASATTLAVALASLGATHFRLHEPDLAEADLREALALDPGLMLAAENLIYVLYKQGRTDEGRALAEQRYRTRSFTAHEPPPAAQGTLLLLWSLDGTVPHRHLLDGLPMRIIDWHIAYAAPAHEAALPPYDLVLNLIGDADEGAAALDAALNFQPRCTAPMLNNPARIGLTSRDGMPRLLEGIAGLVIPRASRMAAEALASEGAEALAAHGLDLPVLIRGAGRHGGESAARVLTEASLKDEAAALTGPVYVTQYADTCSADGFFRKYRMIFVNRAPYPYHLAISPHWLVHYFSAEMEAHDWKLEEELRFLNDPEAALGGVAMAALRGAAQRMDLDYCGMDFSLLPDGRVLVFECNATMLVHPESQTGPLARKNPAIRRIVQAFQTHLLAALPNRAAAQA